VADHKCNHAIPDLEPTEGNLLLVWAIIFLIWDDPKDLEVTIQQSQYRRGAWIRVVGTIGQIAAIQAIVKTRSWEKCGPEFVKAEEKVREHFTASVPPEDDDWIGDDLDYFDDDYADPWVDIRSDVVKQSTLVVKKSKQE